MSEAEKLTAFLLAVQTSSAQRDELKRDPHGVLRRFDLGPETIDALRRKDYMALWGILTSSGTREIWEIMTTVGVEKGRRRRKREHA